MDRCLRFAGVALCVGLFVAEGCSSDDTASNSSTNTAGSAGTTNAGNGGGSAQGGSSSAGAGGDAKGGSSNAGTGGGGTNAGAAGASAGEAGSSGEAGEAGAPVVTPTEPHAGQCATPRSGVDPITNTKYVDVQGSVLDEQLWLQAWTNDTYLWFDEVPAADPTSFATAIDYFNVLKTPAITASGKAKDAFHFTYETAQWEALSDASSGTETGYGINWALLSATPPRQLVVADVEPSSPGQLAGLVRGTEVLTIDGVDVQNGTDTDTLNNGISPVNANEQHTFVIQNPGEAETQTITLTSSDEIAVTPVRDTRVLPAPADHVGYLLFTDHIAGAEKGLVDAITTLESAKITDLVLDLRYNGGGLLDLAAELGYMIAGPAQTSGKIFEREVFNSKHPTTDPVTGEPLAPTPFYDTTQGYSVTAGQPLPHLDLTRVFVLTGADTCSASESVMNGLAGVGVRVIQIGDTTCGKPYGFYPADNCGTTYFSIQFQAANAQGFGDYADGFTPGEKNAGCIVEDDFEHALGDPAEGRLATALYFRDNAACPPAPPSPERALTTRATGDAIAKLLRQKNRIAARFR